MIAFAGMLVEAAKKAGMKVPSDPENFDTNQFPHFYVFCEAQLGRPNAYPGEHWDNAKVIAKIPDNKIKKVTFEKLIKMGWSFKT